MECSEVTGPGSVRETFGHKSRSEVKERMRTDRTIIHFNHLSHLTNENI